MITTTVRLPQALKAEAETLAESLGISMTALMAVALRDYLDRPVMRWSALPSEAAASPGGHSTKLLAPGAPVTVAAGETAQAAVQVLTFKPPRSRSDPCPCGATDPSGTFRLKFKQCHGRLASGSA